jgi:hypothetical protein
MVRLRSGHSRGLKLALTFVILVQKSILTPEALELDGRNYGLLACGNFDVVFP